MDKAKTLGLALGSGAAKGLAHIGVLKAFEEKGVRIDFLSGASMGALVAACYASRGRISDLEDVALSTDWKKLLKLADPRLILLSKGMIHGKKVKELLFTLIGDISFSDLKTPLFIIAADAYTGEEVVLNEGSVVEAVMASAAIPGIFTPVHIKDRFLIDGGIIDPVPVRVLKDLGADHVVACNVIDIPYKRKRFTAVKQRPYKKEKSPSPALKAFNEKLKAFLSESTRSSAAFRSFFHKMKKRISSPHEGTAPETPSIFITLVQSFYVMQYEIASLKMKEADLLISPDVSRIATWEFFRARELVEEGLRAARKALKDAPFF